MAENQQQQQQQKQQQQQQHQDQDRDYGQNQVHLLKTVGFLDAAALIIGLIIGSGIFISPGGVLKNVRSTGMSLIVWVVTGAITTLESFCYIELALTFPEMGGEYIYIKKGFGNMIAFLYMWVYWCFMTSTGSAIVALTFSTYFSKMFWPTCAPPPGANALFAATAITLLVGAQCINPKIGYMTSNLFTIAKISGLLLVIAGGFIYMGVVGTEKLQVDLFHGSAEDPASYVLAFYQAYWAFSGTTTLFQIMEEIKDPLKPNIIKSVLLGMVSVTLIYLLANLAYIAVLTPEHILASEAVAMTFGREIYSGLIWLIAFVVACSTFGTLNNGILAGARSTIAASRKRHLPKFLGLINKDKHTPVPAHIAKLLIVLGLLAASEVHDLIYYTVYISTLSSMMCQITLIMLRFTQPNLERPFKLPLAFPVFFLFIQIVLLVFPFFKEPMKPTVCFTFIASGIPVYLIFIRPKKAPEWVLYIEQKITYVVGELCKKSLPKSALDSEEKEKSNTGQDNLAFDKEK